jgi:hypothetical protein
LVWLLSLSLFLSLWQAPHQHHAITNHQDTREARTQQQISRTKQQYMEQLVKVAPTE